MYPFFIPMSYSISAPHLRLKSRLMRPLLNQCPQRLQYAPRVVASTPIETRTIQRSSSIDGLMKGGAGLVDRAHPGEGMSIEGFAFEPRGLVTDADGLQGDRREYAPVLRVAAT